MASPADRILVDLAVRNHLISEAEGEECLREVGGAGDVGDVLLRKKLIKEKHLESLRRKLGKIQAEGGVPAAVPASGAAASAPDPMEASDATFVSSERDVSALLSGSAALVLFGQIAVDRQLVTQGDIDRALRLQEQLAQQGNPMRLGEILVRAKRLTPEQVQELLAFQEKWIVVCQVCSRRFNVSASQSEGMRCAACGGELSQASAGTSGIGVEATHGAAGGGLAPRAAAAGPAATGATDERGPGTADDPGGLLGRTWKGYRVEKILGKGGMGAVYRATQLSLRREVALKVMLRRGGTGPSPEERERFEREAKLIGNLNHPNIVKVIHAEWGDDLCWFTMELVPGQDFKATLRTGQFPIGKGAGVVAKVARAMDFAHRKGIIHRDLKPQNVMIDAESGEPKVLDFGLAKNVDKEQLEQLTQMGAFLGTPSYMAPEQAGGDPSAIDARADVYALGAILYEVLTGQPPFTGKKAIHVIKKVLKEDPLPPQQVFAQADPRLSAIALKALAKDPGDRQQTAGELADAIEQVIGRVSRSFGPAPAGEAGEQGSGTGSSASSSESKRKKGFFGLFG